MDPRTNAFILMYRQQKEALLAEFPELVDDQETLADTLEGMSFAPALIADLVRDALMDEATAEALSIRMNDMAARKQRILHRADRRRQAAQHLMAACEIRKIEQPDFTVSVRAVPPRVDVYAEEQLPDALCKFTRSPDRTKIKEALADGPVSGARMTNGSETLTVRTK